MLSYMKPSISFALIKKIYIKKKISTILYFFVVCYKYNFVYLLKFLLTNNIQTVNV